MPRRVLTLLLVAGGAALPFTPALADESDPAREYSTVSPAPSSHLVRAAPGARASAARHDRRRSLAYFAHLTDTQIADEASPARHEQLFGRQPMYAGFWRPQEAFILHAVDQTVRAVNEQAVSRVPSGGGRAQLGFALVTGNMADTAQVNEVRWGVRVLEGGRVNPFSGRRISPRNPCDAPAGVRQRLNRAVAQRRYAGVAASRRWLARWPGALDVAQRPFVAEGLAVPWYAARGNHDALPQGHYGPSVTYPRSTPTGCRKVLGRRSTAGHPWDVLRQSLPSGQFVPPDPRRRFVRSAAEFRRLHGRADNAHGFGFTRAGERRLPRHRALLRLVSAPGAPLRRP